MLQRPTEGYPLPLKLHSHRELTSLVLNYWTTQNSKTRGAQQVGSVWSLLVQIPPFCHFRDLFCVVSAFWTTSPVHCTGLQQMLYLVLSRGRSVFCAELVQAITNQAFSHMCLSSRATATVRLCLTNSASGFIVYISSAQLRKGCHDLCDYPTTPAVML